MLFLSVDGYFRGVNGPPHHFVAAAAAAVVVVVVAVEYHCFLIIIIVGASVPRLVQNLLCFTALSLPYELKTIVLASRPLGCPLLLLAFLCRIFCLIARKLTFLLFSSIASSRWGPLAPLWWHRVADPM